MRIGLVLFSVTILVWSNASGAETAKPWMDQQWLRLFQYEKSIFGGWVSDIKNDSYFFDPQGRTSPEHEYQAAIRAYQDVSTLIGVQKLPAACVFPARKLILERISQQRFPKVACPDLYQWLQAIEFERVSLVYAGAYGGNPASILGHTFLNFSRKAENDQGASLLSYSIGFLAKPEPTDSRVLYVLKGITGGYPGYFDIEPHYMKVGLYNNAESRDLWEWELRLTNSQAELLLMHIWELTFNAQFGYYFIDENCAYRLLAILEVIAPEYKFLKKLGLVVTPSQTVRVVADAGLAAKEAVYRPSLLRKLEYQLSHMNATQLSEYNKKIKGEPTEITKPDIIVLDALIDHWLHQVLKNRGQLSEEQPARQEQALVDRSLTSERNPLVVNSQRVQSYFELQPILDGHKERFISAFIGRVDGLYYGEIDFSLGIHPDWARSLGYDQIHQFEYLGINWRSSEYKKTDEVILKIAKVKAINPIDFDSQPLSWGFYFDWQNKGGICDFVAQTSCLNLEAFVGYAFRFKRWTTYVFPEIQFQTWFEDHFKMGLPIGGVLGVVFEQRQWKSILEYNKIWWQQTTRDQLRLDLSYFFSTNVAFRANVHALTQTQQRHSLDTKLGMSWFF